MKTIAQFKITKDEDIYIAEGIDLPIVTQSSNLDELVKNIGEAVSLHLENEDLKAFDFSKKPSILINFELPQYA